VLVRRVASNGAGSGSCKLNTTFSPYFSAQTADERLKDKWNYIPQPPVGKKLLAHLVGQFWLALGCASGDNRIHDSALGRGR
jgi:hypothetical protein